MSGKISYENENERLKDESRCAAPRADLKMCLLESDCCKIYKRTPRECLLISDGTVPEECQALRYTFFNCKHSLFRFTPLNLYSPSWTVGAGFVDPRDISTRSNIAKNKEYFPRLTRRMPSSPSPSLAIIERISVYSTIEDRQSKERSQKVY